MEKGCLVSTNVGDAASNQVRMKETSLEKLINVYFDTSGMNYHEYYMCGNAIVLEPIRGYSKGDIVELVYDYRYGKVTVNDSDLYISFAF